ncbi:MAG: hypothetical protein D6705_05285 [Deltaproteobacteria bacterium]|nr:MAG: hypothetical protein D6705_05285 [Deltaproteobacteria bacterium]
MSSEVKGIWFLSLKGYLEREDGPGAWQAFCDEFLEEYRDAVRDPLPSAWYPEEMLQDQLGLMHGRLAGGDDDAFVRLVEDVSVGGIGRFFRILLGLGSPRFAMKQIPTLWARLRRGPSSGQVRVDAGKTGALMEVTNFPFLADRNYRLLQVGTLRATLRVVGAKDVDVRIAEAGTDHARIEIAYR